MKRWFLSIIFILIAVSCSPASNSPVATTASVTSTSTLTPLPTLTFTPSPTPTSTPDPGPWYGVPITVAQANQVQLLAMWGKGVPWVLRDSIWYAPGKDNQISSGTRRYSGMDLGEIWLPGAAMLAADGQVLVVQSPTGIFLYSTSNAKQIAWLEDATVYKLSKDESMIVTGHKDGAVRVWNILDGTLIQEFHHELGIAKDFYTIGPAAVPSVGDVAISADGKQVAAGFADERILVWRLDNPGIATTLNIEFSSWQVGVVDIEFSPDGKLLLSLAGNGIALWRLQDSSKLWEIWESYLALRTNRLQTGFSPDGKMMAFLFESEFRLLDIDGNVVYKYSNRSEETEYYHISEDWTQIFVDRLESGQRQIRSLPDGKLLETVPLPENQPPFSLFEQGHVWGLRGVKVQADHSVLAWGFTNERIYWWWPEENKFTTYPKDGHDVYFSPDGSMVAKCEGGPIVVINVNGREQQFDVEGHQTCDGLVFSPRGDSFAVWTQERLDLVSLSTGEMRSLRDNTKPIISAVFSGDGTFLASAERSYPVNIAVWDVATRERVAKFVADGDWYAYGRVPPYYVLTFSPDNKTLAARGHGNDVWLWDIPGNASARRLDVSGDVVAFSPDGKILAVANRAGIISLWSLPAGEKMTELRGHVHLFGRTTHINDSVPYLTLPPDGLGALSVEREANADFNVHSVSSLTFLPDGDGLLSVGVDGTIRLWGIDPSRTDPVPPPPILDVIFESLKLWDTVDLAGPLKFKVYPVTGAESYSWTLYQNDRIVWEAETQQPVLVLPKNQERDQQIRRTDIHIWVSARVNGKWLSQNVIAVHVK